MENLVPLGFATKDIRQGIAYCYSCGTPVCFVYGKELRMLRDKLTKTLKDIQKSKESNKNKGLAYVIKEIDKLLAIIPE